MVIYKDYTEMQKKSTEGQRHYGHNQHEKTHMVWTRPKNARRTMAEKDAELDTKQEKKKEKTQKSMEREYTARNGMEEFTTRGLGEQERMASRMRETATAVKKPLIYIYIYKSLWELRWNEYIKVTLS